MRDTPRTYEQALFVDCDDSCCEHYERKDKNGPYVSSDFARQLERELAEAKEQLREAVELVKKYEKRIIDHRDGCDVFTGFGNCDCGLACLRLGLDR